MAKRLGQALREARLQRGVDLTEVERVTKIRVKFLRAMEDDRWDDLPPRAYARSFLQTYARYLDLDDKALVDRYRETLEPDEPDEAIPSGIIRSGSIETGRSLRPVVFVLAGLAAAAGIALIVAAIGSGGSENESPSKADHNRPAASNEATATAQTTTTAPDSDLSVELSPTADVWVCLVDDQGQALVDGVILTSGETQGPFTGRSFEATFGNGSVQMTVNGEPASIPASASPLNYRITPTGAKELASGSGPSCA
jgi:cytoskeletal protein RodZ